MRREKGAEAEGPSRNSVFLLGFSFWQAWQMFVLSTNILVPLPAVEAGSHFPNTFWIYGAVALGIPVAIILKRHTRISLEVESRWAGGLALVGTLLVNCYSSFSVGAPIVFMVGVLCCGIGSGLLLLEWGEFWSTLARAEVVKSVCASYAMAFPVFFLLASLPQWLCISCIALLLLFSTWTLQQGRKVEHRLPPRQPLPLNPPPVSHIYGVIVGLSVAFGVVQSFYRLVYPLFSYFDAVIAGICILAVTLRLVLLADDDDPATLYRTSMPLVVGGITVMLALPANFASCGFGFVLAGIYCLDALIIIVGTDMAFRMQKPVIFVFGWAFFASRIASFAARVASYSLIATGLWTLEVVESVMVSVLLLLIIVGFIVFPVNDLMRLYLLPSGEIRSETRIDNACKAIADSYGLTARELEILRYLAHGRSVPYICEKLCISPNTGKRHVSNIYRKLCIYNRQSLHDLVEHYGEL